MNEYKEMLANAEKVNEDNKDYSKFLYLIALDSYASKFFAVYANDLQDAMDCLADYCEDKEYAGYFNDEQMETYYDEDHEDHAYMQDYYSPTGNHGRMFRNPTFVEEHAI